MNNVIKSSFYAVAWLLLLGLNSANAAIGFWEDKVNTGLKGSENSLEQTVQNLVSNFMIFLSIIAVLYLLWWGMNILTAAWDDEKVKKWKTVIIHAVIWLFVIFIANSVIIWVLGLFVWA